MTQPGIEPGHPRTLYPDDVIRNTICHVGRPIYVVNEVLFISHSLLTLRIYVIYKIYYIHISYIQYILHIRYIIHIQDVYFFLFGTPQAPLYCFQKLCKRMASCSRSCIYIFIYVYICQKMADVRLAFVFYLKISFLFLSVEYLTNEMDLKTTLTNTM